MKETHNTCAPIQAEFGDHIEAASTMSNPDLAELSNDIAVSIAEGMRKDNAQTASNPERSYESGASARLALIRNECGTCALQGCMVKQQLEDVSANRSWGESDSSRPLQFDSKVEFIIGPIASTSNIPELQNIKAAERHDIPTYILSGRQTCKPFTKIIDARDAVQTGKIEPAQDHVNLIFSYKSCRSLLQNRSRVEQPRHLQQQTRPW